MALPTSDLAAEPAAIPGVLELADACLIASHRLSEWVSSAPTMEEDVALGNIALDLLGQARGLLSHLGDEDELAYLRDAADFRNPTICELPNGDFGHTMLRALFIDRWLQLVWRSLVSDSESDEVVRGVAEKAVKENAYHLRHSSAWVVRLGDGTEESHRRMLDALAELWPYTAEIAVDGWHDGIATVLTDATLPVRKPAVSATLGSRGDHTDHLEALLADAQAVARAHPGAAW
jgi:ring-1,2-phenylacetyl-CoA epoxidase subunit PaaC